GGDIGAGAGGGIGCGVVGRIGAAQGDATHQDALGGANVRVGETGAGVAGGEAVAGRSIIGEGDRGAGGAVIDLVDPGGRYAQRAGSDVGSGAGGVVKGVVARVNAADGDAADTDTPRGAGILAGEGGAGVAGSQSIAGHAIVRQSDGGAGGPVIHLVGAGG